MMQVMTTNLSKYFGNNNENMKRPTIKVKFKGSTDYTNMLFDTGAQISILSTKSFRRIPPHLRPTKIPTNLSATGANGKAINIKGCYIMQVVVAGVMVNHPFFVADLPNNDGIVGIDLIKATKLSFDGTTGIPFFSKGPKEARLAEDLFLQPRQAKLGAVNCEDSCYDRTQVLSIFIPGCSPKIVEDQVLVKPSKHHRTKVYFTNVSQETMRIPKGTPIGEFEEVSEDQLEPWSPAKTMAKIMVPNSVQETTTDPDPIRPPVQATPLTEERKKKIMEMANFKHLDDKLSKEYFKLLFMYHDALSLSEFELGCTNMGKHRITLEENARPVYQKQFPLPYAHLEELKRQIIQYRKLGVVQGPAETEFNSPLFLVKKKAPPGGLPGFRIVVDMRNLNQITKPSNYRLPEVHECLDRIASKKPKVFTSLDLRNGFFQISLDPASRHLTGFNIPGLGTFQWSRTCQGLRNSPQSMQRILTRILGQHIVKTEAEVYLDDILLYSSSHQEMMRILGEVLKKLRNAKLKLNLEKCSIGTDSLEYLGFSITGSGYSITKKAAKAISEMLPPTSLKLLRSYVGKLQFYRITVDKFTQLIKPLTNLTKKNSEWSGGPLPALAQKAFDLTKKIMTSRPFLHFPDFNLRFYLYTDGSLGDNSTVPGGLGCCLMQFDNNDTNNPPKAIGFASRSLTSAERNYTTSMVESLSICFGVEYFEKYLKGKPFTIMNDHAPIISASANRKSTGTHKRTIERFREILASFDFDIQYVKGNHNVADYLSRRTGTMEASAIETEVMGISELFEMYDKSITNLEKVSNLQSRPSSKEGAMQMVVGDPCLAEPLADEDILDATEAPPKADDPLSAGAHPVEGPEIVKKELYNVNVKPVAMLQKDDLSRPDSSFEILSLPERPLNSHEPDTQTIHACTSKPEVSCCEKLCNTAKKFGKVCISAVKKIINLHLSEFKDAKERIGTLLKCQNDDPLINVIKTFLRTKELPKKCFRSIVKRFGPECFVDKHGLLLRQFNQDGQLPRNVIVCPAVDTAKVIAAAHTDAFSGHCSIERTCNKLKEIYWWPNMYSDIFQFIDSCRVCDKNKSSLKPVSNTYLSPLEPVTSPQVRVGFDLYGPVISETGAKNYILVIVDHFSRFAIFEQIQTKSAQEVAKVFFEKYCLVLGIPRVLISDLGSEFNNEVMKYLCNHLQIDKRFSSASHPMTNGATEVINRYIRKYLTNMITEKQMGWEHHLKTCQFAYNTSIHSSHKNSPYYLMFGTSPNTPLNNLSFITKPIYGEKIQHDWMRKLQFARNLAVQNSRKFQEIYTKKFNSKVVPKNFQVGMLVFAHLPELVKRNPKLTSPWFGPYVILELFNDSKTKHDHCALIQQLDTKKTKFLNLNRLRHFKASISDWQKYNQQTKNPDTVQQPEEKSDVSNKQSTAQYMEFSHDGDVTILNPQDPPPAPIPLKVEPDPIDPSLPSEPQLDPEVSPAPPVTPPLVHPKIEPPSPIDQDSESTSTGISDQAGPSTSMPSSTGGKQ